MGGGETNKLVRAELKLELSHNPPRTLTRRRAVRAAQYESAAINTYLGDKFAAGRGEEDECAAGGRLVPAAGTRERGR